GLEVADDERRPRLLAPLPPPRPLLLAFLRRLGAARARAVLLGPGGVPLLHELVGQPAARLLRQLEAAHVRDARDRAAAEVEDAERVLRHVRRLRALRLRLLERLLRRLQAEDDEAAVVAEPRALAPFDAERLGRGGERLDHEHRVAAIRLEAVERGAAVRRERLADDAVPDVVVRMIERLASGRLPGSAGGAQQQGQAAGQRAAARGHRVLLELGPDASGANYGTGGRRGPGPLPRRPCTQTVGAERKQVRPPLRPCGHPTGDPEARSRSISRTATSPASRGRAPHTP